MNVCFCVSRELKLDMVPREESGEIINPTDVSIVHLYKVVSMLILSSACLLCGRWSQGGEAEFGRRDGE